MSNRIAAILVVGLLGTLTALLGFQSHYIEPNTCSESWSTPVYVSLEVDSPNALVRNKYKLYLYREGYHSADFKTERDAPNLGGTPVLFLPGNAGSHNQGRSLAARSSISHEFDWFLADFDADLSAFHGKTLLDESVYINDAIKYILGLYKYHSNKPESVIIVGHSMGGVVARALPTLDNYIPRSISSIITLASPHVYPPVTFDRDITQLYDLVNQWWRYSEPDISLISIAGGHNDMLVLPDICIADSFNAPTLFTYELDTLRVGVDHLAIVWCGELKNRICDSIDEVSEPMNPRRIAGKEKVYEVFKKNFKEDHSPGDAPYKLETGNSMLYGRSFTHSLQGLTDIQLPLKSSLISYKASFSAPVELVHYTSYEYRKYGPENLPDPLITSDTIMWYSAGPYIPFRNRSEPLFLEIKPRYENTEMHLRIAWKATFANIAIHYRTLAASWPFAIIVLATLHLSLQYNRQPKVESNEITFRYSFSKSLFRVIGSSFLPLMAVLSILHLMLIRPWFRDIVRSLQYPSESANMASLRHTNHDVNDLLLGNNDPELVWIIPLLLAVACSAVLIIHYVVLFVVSMRQMVSPRFARLRARLPRMPGCWRKATPRAKKIVTLVGGITGLYFVPYQVTTVGLAVYELLTISSDSGFHTAFTEILMWVSVVDAPIIVVWLGNINFQWLRAFASFRNVSASLPLYLYVVYGTPYPTRSPVLLRWLTIAVFAYISGFALVYGCLHAFMIHHLTCYLALWMLAATYDTL